MQKIGFLFVLLVSGSFTFAMNYNPEGQVRNHAAAWALSRLKCSEFLDQDAATQPSIVAATNDLLGQLIGDNQMPKAPSDKELIGPAYFWRDIRDLDEPTRQLIAEKIYEIEDLSLENAGEAFSFGHVVRGEASIKAYTERYLKEYRESHRELADEPKILKAKEQAEQGRAVKHTLLASAIAAASAVAISKYPIAAPALMTTAVAIMSGRPLLQTVRMLGGPKAYRASIASDLSSDNSVESLLRALRDDQLKRPEGLILENDFQILSAAIKPITGRDARNLSEVNRSCRVFSPSRPCEEVAALIESRQANQDHGQGTTSAWGRMMTVLFHDSSGEPVLINWIRFYLNPLKAGIAKPTEDEVSVEQDQHMPAPVLVPIPVHTGRGSRVRR
jgi:hypothetical protein